jgi:hypothetical protein
VWDVERLRRALSAIGYHEVGLDNGVIRFAPGDPDAFGYEMACFDVSLGEVHGTDVRRALLDAKISTEDLQAALRTF